MTNLDPPFVQENPNFKLPTLAEVDAYELPSLLKPRLVDEDGYTPEDAEALMREAKRMLYLSAIMGGGISPSKKVDHAWHAMLMFTRSYYKFANFIGRYVHHEPTEGPPDGGKTYRATKENYEKHFGIKPDPKYWP